MSMNHSTDSFMFRSFEAHSRIFHKSNLADYFMISSGTNQFPMPQIWKESICKELETDFLYRWYTDSHGFQCITSAIKVYEDYLSGSGLNNFAYSRRQVCMTTGGCGAASAVFEYLKTTYDRCRVILVGMNYSLYERIAKEYHFPIQELRCTDNLDALPTPEDFRQMGQCEEKSVFVFSIPNNPTGESYSVAHFTEIVAEIKKRSGFIILDQVCNLIISKRPLPLLEPVITLHKYWHSCAVVNSFSKTDSTAGLRLGYVYGEDHMIRLCADLNARTVMNPPTFPAFPIVLTCLFRCLYLSNLYGLPELNEQFKRRFRNIFFITSAVIPPSMKDYAEKVFAHLDYCFQWYVDELLQNEAIIRKNYDATCDIFRPYIRKVSKLDGSFNFCVWFHQDFRMDELALIEQLIDRTGVAILTESSFSLKTVHDKSFFIRFSTACGQVAYGAALQRLKAFLESEGFAFEKHTN